MSSLPLFDPPRSRYAVDDVCSSRHKGAETSEDAHQAGQLLRARQRAQVLARLEKLGPHGATSEELSEQLRMRYTTASARVSQLKMKGDVVATKRRRPTSSGHGAFVVVLARYAPPEEKPS